MDGRTEILGVDSKFDSILNQLRKRRTLSLKIAFPILIGKDIVMGNKPHELAISTELSWYAVAWARFVLAGVWIRLWARGHFAREGLFTTGPYALVRHPLYLGSLMIVVGVLFQLNGWVNWVIILPLFSLFHGIAIIYEERTLASRFGFIWSSYASRVPSLVPSLCSLSNTGRSEKWQLGRFLRTHEFFTTVMALSLPFLIELLEDVVFEGILHV